MIPITMRTTIRTASIVSLAILASGTILSAQSAQTSARKTLHDCKQSCDRPTPFGHTQGLNVVIMVRESFTNSTYAAVIRDDPGVGKPVLVALKRGAMNPDLLYRALASISETRTKHNGPPPQRATSVLLGSAKFQSVPTEDQAWVARVLQSLSTAPQTTIDGVGVFPAITLVLDEAALRGR